MFSILRSASRSKMWSVTPGSSSTARVVCVQTSVRRQGKRAVALNEKAELKSSKRYVNDGVIWCLNWRHVEEFLSTARRSKHNWSFGVQCDEWDGIGYDAWIAQHSTAQYSTDFNCTHTHVHMQDLFYLIPPTQPYISYRQKK